MITSRRDYILRIIDEITRMVARIIFKRRGGSDQEALELCVQGFERLFNLERNQLFQFTPDQQFVMLTLDEPPEIARDKALLYAALSTEAGLTYEKIGEQRMATATFSNALRFVLKARTINVDAPLPDFAPRVDELVGRIGEANLLPDLKQMLAQG